MEKKGEIPKNNTNNKKEDRLSSLPDSILLDILSRLDMKEVVGNTSLISKRWRYLWASVPCLNFDHSLWEKKKKKENRLIKIAFMDFVDRVLLLRDDSHITKLVLSCSYFCDGDRVDTWLTIAGRRDVEDIHLQCFPERPFALSINKKNNNNNDRLSSLPDLILLNILSRLDMKEVVGNTSLISKRWRYLWTSVPCLNFDHSLWEKKHAFMDFVDRVLLLRDNSLIAKLVLNCSNFCDDSRVDTWLTVAARRQVEDVDLQWIPCGQTEISGHVFTSSISIFKCNGDGMQLPETLCVSPRLKTLHLEGAKLSKGNATAGVLVLSCPLLENLSIIHCNHGDLHVLKINAPQLRNLFIDNLKWLSRNSSCELQVRSSKLLSLELRGHQYKKYFLPTLFSIVSAKLFGSQKSPPSYPLNKLPDDFRHAKSLELNGSFLKHEKIADKLSHSLLELERVKLMGKWSISCLYCTLNLLSSSPCLETLDMELTFQMPEAEDSGQELLPDMFHCLKTMDMFHCLKTIKVRGLEGSKVELKLLGCLLKNATVLEKLIVTMTYSPNQAKVLENFEERVRSMPRASPNIAVILRSSPMEYYA